MQYLLYNPQSGHGGTQACTEEYQAAHATDARLVDITEIHEMRDFLETLNGEDSIVLFGGDGTLNRFINAVPDAPDRVAIYYYPSGTGNDFCADIGCTVEDAPIKINEYLTALPRVTVNGEEHLFLNGVGYGIDGYCCEVGDKLRAAGKKANYTAIAIKGMLFHFSSRNATVTVDGVEHHFKNVWIAPTMHGARYGGGMLPAPAQKRSMTDQLSLVIFHGRSRLHTLMVFPSIFSGKHVKHTKQVSVLTGREITVAFDRPTPLQIDGETILDVTSYSARVAGTVAAQADAAVSEIASV